MAALLGVAGLIYAMRWPADNASPPPAEPAVAALPLNLPAAVPPEAPASAPPRPLAPIDTAGATAPPHMGSEGYGPHIERALAGHDAAAAWEAVQWLRQCASNEVRRNSFETVRNQGVAPEMMTQLMVEADAEARRCQTVTAQHRALLPELAARAMRAGVPEAASAYASAVFPADLTPDQRQEVAAAMRRDATAGHALSLLGAVLAHEAWGLSDTERLGFLAAYGQLQDQPGAQATVKLLLEQGVIRFKAPPTAEQQAAARLAGQQIVDLARASRQP